MTCTCEFSYDDSEIHFCPLHSASEAMLEALKRAEFHMLCRGWAVSQGHELREVYEQTKAARIAAEGAEGKAEQ